QVRERERAEVGCLLGHLGRGADAALNRLPSGLSNATGRFRADPHDVADALRRLPHRLDPLTLLTRNSFGLFTLLASRGPALFGLSALGCLHLGLRALDLLDDGLGL